MKIKLDKSIYIVYLNYPKYMEISEAMNIAFSGIKREFKITMVNKSSVFESVMLPCIMYSNFWTSAAGGD